MARRRRKRRRADDSFEYYFDEPERIAIKDIKEGDMVLSLNEKTGHMEWKPVVALYDMGEQPVYKLTTESGKTIRTTGTHPYLTPWGWVRVAELRVGNAIAAPKEEALTAMTRIGVGTPLDLGYQNLASQPIENHAVVAHAVAVFIAVAARKFVRKMERIFLREIKTNLFNNAELDVPLKLAHIAPSVLGECVIHHSPSDFSIVREEIRPERRDASISFQNFGLAYSMLSSKFSSDSTKRLATAAGARRDSLSLRDLFADVFVAIRDKSISIARRLSNYDEDIAFERIVAIEYDGIEQVWDIAVSGTHNFVAEGLLAHNTYLGNLLASASSQPGGTSRCLSARASEP